MITFECPKCGKPLITPNSKAGTHMACPGCRDELLVPQPRPPSQLGRYARFGFLLAAVVAAVAVAGSWTYQERRKAGVRERLQAELRLAGEQWQGVTWQKCEPRTGEFQFSVFYVGEDDRYEFEVNSFPEMGHTFVVANPTKDAWLARATFAHGEQDSFRYLGLNDAERQHLNGLTHELADAIHQAVGR